jgi:hypothetical protein
MSAFNTRFSSLRYSMDVELVAVHPPREDHEQESKRESSQSFVLEGSAAFSDSTTSKT